MNEEQEVTTHQDDSKPQTAEMKESEPDDSPIADKPVLSPQEKTP